MAGLINDGGTASVHTESASTTSDDGIAMPPQLNGIDRERWLALTAAQRRRALIRLDAFDGWNSRSLGIDEALRMTDLSRSRFYRMAADWRAAPSLTALGVFAGTGGKRSRLDPGKVNALQAVVADVVAMNAGATVSQLVQIMLQEAGGSTEGLPGMSTLRAIVETELRRVAATGEAGNALKLDCSAINIPAEGGRPHVMFVVLDEGTRLILGAAVAADGDAAEGYRRASTDALERIRRVGGGLQWALRTARMEITAGTDVAGSIGLVERLRSSGLRANVQLARAPRRFGRYFRAIVGTRIGRIEITPSRTEWGMALADNGDTTVWTTEEAEAALRISVERHNETVLADLPIEKSRRVPDDLLHALTILSASPGDG